MRLWRGLGRDNSRSNRCGRVGFPLVMDTKPVREFPLLWTKNLSRNFLYYGQLTCSGISLLWTKLVREFPCMGKEPVREIPCRGQPCSGISLLTKTVRQFTYYGQNTCSGISLLWTKHLFGNFLCYGHKPVREFPYYGQNTCSGIPCYGHNLFGIVLLWTKPVSGISMLLTKSVRELSLLWTKAVREFPCDGQNLFENFLIIGEKLVREFLVMDT